MRARTLYTYTMRRPLLIKIDGAFHAPKSERIAVSQQASILPRDRAASPTAQREYHSADISPGAPMLRYEFTYFVDDAEASGHYQ